jgi:regulatory protein
MWRKRLELDQERKRFIKNAEQSRERTMNRAIKLLAAKPRPVEELRERLLEKSWTDEAIVGGVIEKLKEYGYLDDEKYAGDLALAKLRQKPQGKRRLKHALSQKRLSKENVDAAVKFAFERMPEPELIDTAIEKRLRLKGVPEARDDLKKFYDHLLRQGFEYDLIRSKMSVIAGKKPVDETVADADEDQLR